MADLTNVTTLINGDVFDPQVVTDMINAKVEKRAVMTGYVKVDNTLEGVAGSSVTVPKWGYIGPAEDLEEGQPIDATKMAYTTASYTVKKIGKGVMITDEAQNSGFGNPVGTATAQIATSISDKLDNDRVNVLIESKNIFDATANKIGYASIVDGVDVFADEEETRKVILIHSSQKTTLRKDAEFISADKYGAGVMASGSIGRIAGCDVVVSNKVPKFDTWYKIDSTGTAVTEETLPTVKASLPFVKVGDKVKAVNTPAYFNPIIKLDSAETDDEISAVTYFIKKGNLVENDRVVGVGNNIVCTAHGTPALTNEEKVVILKTKA